MASISEQSNGRRTIQFTGADGKRRSIRLGRVGHRAAESVKLHVEHLVTASITRQAPPDETARWVAGLDVVMADKLARVGLIPKREAVTLGPFLADYRASFNVKAGTLTAYNHTAHYLTGFFGDDRALRSIGPAEADRFRRHLIESGLSAATVARRVGVARQMFKRALRWKLITENPFADLTAGAQTNKARMFYVTPEMAEKVLEACPDGQWRLLFALARYGGLRIPSEALGLRWADVDWERGRIVVHSPKTEHHAGGDQRQIPLFPELLPHLREAFEAAEPGAEHVITRYRDTSANLRTHALRIIRRAGLTPWPKPFQNLRSSRETELCERWPLHVVCTWIGNSQPVAAKHYLQVRDEDFDAAVSEAADSRAAKSGAVGARNGVQEAATATNEPHWRYNQCGSNDLPRPGMGATGFEPVTLRV